MLRPITFAVVLYLALTSLVERADAATASLKIYWSKPVPSGGLLPSGALVLRDLTHSTDGSIALHASGSRSRLLLVEPDETGSGSVMHLKSKAEVLASRIASGVGNTFWLGGRINQRAYVPGGDLADAYLGRFDRQGRTVAEYTFRSRSPLSRNFRMIQDLLPLPSGKIIIAGVDGNENWLGMVSDQGKLLWEQRFGIGKGIALITVSDRIMAVAFERTTTSDKKPYQEDVTVWSFDQTGNALARQTIRAGINESSGAAYGRLAFERTNDAIYVLSSWGDPSNAKPIEVTKLSANGNPIWRKELSHSISQQPNKAKTWRSCDQGQTVLAGGDLLVACSIKDKIFIFRLDAKGGDLTVMSVPLPACHESRPTALFFNQRPNGAIWLFGSRPGSNVGASCTWLGELSLR